MPTLPQRHRPSFDLFRICAFVLLAAAAASAAGAGALRVRPVEIVDRQGFERPMTAASMMLPAGWQHEATVQWRRTMSNCARLYDLRLRAAAADGSESIELMPGEVWLASNFGMPDPSCRRAGFDNAQAYLRAWLQQHRPGARWLGWEARADFVQAPVDTPIGPGAGMRRWADGGRALVEWTENGRTMQEFVAVGVSFTSSRMPGLPGQPPVQTLSGESRGVLTWRAPSGRLDPRQFDALWATLRSDPAWRARVAQGMNAMARDNAATSAEVLRIQGETGRQAIAEMARRGDMLARDRAEMAAMQQKGFDQRSASQDRMQTRTVQAIRGVEPWRDAGGATVELPSSYAHAWRLRDGSYVLTDDAGFRPGRDLGVEGEALKPAPR